MHQRPPADPNSKDDLLVPADVSFATMTTNRTASPAADFSAFVAPDPLDAGAVYHGDGSGESHGADGGGGRIETTAEGRNAVEFFDDVFGSSPDDHLRGPRPPSGAATASLPTIPATTDTARTVPTVHQDNHRHPSDMNRLQQEHSTSGYREGITAGKNATLQAGFDEGYSLGAAIGGIVGELLGLLEALVVSGGEEDEPTTSTASRTTEDATAAQDADPLPVLLGRARRDLTAPSIFSPGYFAADGTWIYDVEASEPAGTETAQAGAAVYTTIFDVANAHPLVKTWRGIVDRQLERRRIRWGKAGDEAALATALGLKDEGESHGGAGEGSTADAAPVATARAPTNDASALDW